MFRKVDLGKFDNSNYKPGSYFIRVLWYFVNILILKNSLISSSFLKKRVLRFFGAKIGKGVIIKPSVNIKYPWKLKIGDHCWIGENVWIDNLDNLEIGDNVCISQGALLICGNHDYKSTTFDLITSPIVIEDGVWICAKAIVSSGVRLKSHSILTIGSVATKDLDPYSINKGNPAIKIKDRFIN